MLLHTVLFSHCFLTLWPLHCFRLSADFKTKNVCPVTRNDFLLIVFCYSSEQIIIDHTLQSKCSLLASIVPLRTFNIHRTFPLHIQFFIVEKGYLDYYNFFINVRHTVCSLYGTFMYIIKRINCLYNQTLGWLHTRGF